MTVVAGVDEAPISAEIVARAIEQAQWRGTDLHLVYVTQLPMVYTEVAINWDEVAQAQRASVWAGLEETIGGSDAPVVKVDLEGYPPDTLVAYANDVGASLLVVGTRGRGDFASLILGSTSHRAIHLAECDVLVVKAILETD
ncbi:MAG TPA: universal stress protein [Acidimicrobiia bacterium]|nr:universal stress protein [Acidimicrobiia bacterium]